MSSKDEVVLKFDSAVKEFRDGPNTIRALDSIDFSISKGEMVAITGRSGSGKSTLLNIAGGLEFLTAGDVYVLGNSLTIIDTKKLSSLRCNTIGYVFQNLNLIPALTAQQNVAIPLEFDGTKKSEADELAMLALRRVGIEELANRTPKELSGGQRQRVAIARAIVGPRQLLLADEPTGALDDLTARGVMDLLAEIAEEGTAVAVVTHDPELAAYANRIVRLKDGKIEEVSQNSSKNSAVIDSDEKES